MEQEMAMGMAAPMVPALRCILVMDNPAILTRSVSLCPVESVYVATTNVSMYKMSHSLIISSKKKTDCARWKNGNRFL